MKTKLLVTVSLLIITFLGNAQVGIGTETPDPSSILDIQSATQGVLISRMTLTERDAIGTPADGLQVYNTTNNTLDIFSNGSWKSFAYSTNSNLVYIYSLDDLPTPEGGAITLDSNKMYVFSGTVNIIDNYININGAGLRGTDPQKDMIISAVSGAVLRSTNKGIYIKELAVVPASPNTQAYSFTDDGTHFCNIFSGSSVVGDGTSLGVEEISGFAAITILQNYWNTSNGVKIGGNVGKFTSGYNFIVDVTNGAGIEFLPDLDANDVDIANNYFIYTGQIGLKVNSLTKVDRGRLTSNMFRNVGAPLDGITFFEIGWSFLQNTNISDSRAIGFVYNNNNTTATTFTNTTDFVKVAGPTTAAVQQKFTAENNKLTYDGRRPIVANIVASINATSPSNGSGFTIAISKNGQPIMAAPVNSISDLGNNNKFQLSINTNINLETDDFIEIFIRSDVGTSPLIVSGLQFNATD
ncbi:hypothetical protein ACFQ0R_01685 [Psychroflexus salinarum]|uniref:Right handed beta helix region n=1 Tax=Psychroflexus salinarum TaxID=546024 RepID=A0ABW3GRA0_9FLAO